ncbi:MAG TPA: hypothetical protein VGH19_06740 [Verrucomicrobiae bacterium]
MASHEFYYNGIALHELGLVTLLEQRTAYTPDDAPQRERVDLTVRINIQEASYADNYAMISRVREALRTANAVFLWKNENGKETLNRTVTVTKHNLPEDPNANGVRMQTLQFDCFYIRHDVAGSVMTATLTVGELNSSLGKITDWQEALTTERRNNMRSTRERTSISVRVRGFIAGDTTLGVEARRTAMLALKNTLIARCNNKEGRLVYGGFDRVVRVTEFSADVNQAVNHIEWSLAADCTIFPNEADYVLADYQLMIRDEGADKILVVTGKVQSHSLEAAQTRITQIVNAAVPGNGFSLQREVRREDAPSTIFADVDGETFAGISFMREYRLPLANTLSLKRPDQDAVSFGDVTGWREVMAHERFGVQKDNIQRTMIKVSARGVRYTDTGNGLEVRRAALQAVKTSMQTEFNRPKVTLKHGDFEREVRPLDFTADIGAEARFLTWEMSFEFALAPDETDYALVEYRVRERDGGADKLLSLTGRIQANSEAKARTRLAQIRSSVLSSRSYSAGLVDTEEDEVSFGNSTTGTDFIDLNFTQEFRKPLAHTLAWTPLNGQAVTLGQITGWSEGLTTERFASHKDERRSVMVGVQVTGQYFTDATQSLTVRRADLQAKKDAWLAAFEAKNGRLVNGSFDRIVRCLDFRPEIDHANKVLTWSLNAEYCRFPNEANFTTVEYRVTERDDGADKMLTLRGRIEANDEAKARTRFGELKTATLQARSYESSRIVQEEVEPSFGVGSGEATTFLELTFTCEYRKQLDNEAKFTPEGGETADQIVLGKVTGMSYVYQSERYSKLRKNRSYAGGVIRLSGVFLADATQPLESRNEQLINLQKAWIAKVNKAQGTLVHGSLTQVVRVTNFDAQIDHAVKALNWSLNGEFSLFPNEAGYALVEYTLTTRKEKESGQTVFVFNGRIGAQTKAAAEGKLNTLRTAVLDGKLDHVLLRSEATPSQIEADTDGAAFTELTFSEEYVVGQSDIVRWRMSLRTREELGSGMRRLSYSGTVTARGDDFEKAKTAAFSKARALGDEKHPFKLDEELTPEDQLTTTGGERLVTVQFSFDYRVRLARMYLELTSETSLDTFGENTDSVNGFVVAETEEAAVECYNANVKAAFEGKLVKSERLSKRNEKLQKKNGEELVPNEFESQFTRFDFSFTVHREKAIGEVAMKYEIQVRDDDNRNRRTYTVSGSVVAPGTQTSAAGGVLRANGKKTTGEKAIHDFLNAMAAMLGTRQGLELKEEKERFIGNPASPSGVIEKSIRTTFSATYEKVMTAEAKVLFCRVSVRNRHSGKRWIAHGIPDGRSIMQECGIAEGRRTVTGEVVATSEAAADAWIGEQRVLLNGAYEDPPEIGTDYDFLPGSAGVVTGEGQNWCWVAKSFTFTETLPDFDYPGN